MTGLPLGTTLGMPGPVENDGRWRTSGQEALGILDADLSMDLRDRRERCDIGHNVLTGFRLQGKLKGMQVKARNQSTTPRGSRGGESAGTMYGETEGWRAPVARTQGKGTTAARAARVSQPIVLLVNG